MGITLLSNNLEDRFLGTGSSGNYTYIGYASDDSGSNFNGVYNPSVHLYQAILITDTEIVTRISSDFNGLWVAIGGSSGGTYTYIGYASDSTGSNFSETYNSSIHLYKAVITSDVEISPITASAFTGLWFYITIENIATPLRLAPRTSREGDGSTYYAVGSMARVEETGDLFSFYLSAPTGTSNDERSIKYSISTDGGKTWGDDIMLAEANPGTSQYLEVGCGYVSGRMFVVYRQLNEVDSRWDMLMTYSDDYGATFVTPYRIDYQTATGNSIFEAILDCIKPMSDGSIGMAFHCSYKAGGVITDPSEYTDLYLMVSRDKGLTWEYNHVDRTTPDGLGGVDDYYSTEPCFQELGDGTVIFISRVDNLNTGTSAPTCYNQYISLDYGVTWSAPEACTFEVFSASQQSPPSLNLLRYNGQPVLALYYYNRADYKVKVIYAKVADLIENGVSAWDVATKTTVVTLDTTTLENGYHNFIHPNGDLEGFGIVFEFSAGGGPVAGAFCNKVYLLNPSVDISFS